LDFVEYRQRAGNRPLCSGAPNQRREQGRAGNSSTGRALRCGFPRQRRTRRHEELRVGFDAYKKDFEDFFAAFPGPVDKFEVQDLSIVTDGNLAFSHSIQPGILTAKDGSKVNLVVRVTDAYRKINGKWLIVHEHLSIPVDLNTGKADPTSKP
jgi:SnoaL-like protein